MQVPSTLPDSTPSSEHGEKQNFASNHNVYDPNAPDGAVRDELGVVCPPHTTERRLLMKIDWKLVPILSILYLLAFLDRTNMANANVVITDANGHKSSLTLDLGLPPTGYNTALTIFFVPYILFEIPSNILLKRFSPHRWLSLCMFAFGLVTTLQGIVQSYGGLLATRFFLGLAESGMFPGCFYLLGLWYKRSEAQKRFSFFFSSTTLAGAFGGLLASAISKMNGIRGYAAWRWIFILEGLLTCVVAIVLYFLIPDFPENAKWCTEEERTYIRARLEAEVGKSAIEKKVTFRDVLHVFKDWKVICAGFMYFGFIVPAYSYAFFAPNILQGFGYSAIETQLHSVAPWGAAFVYSLLIAAASDFAAHRYTFIACSSLLSIAGFAMLLTSISYQAKYAALFLVVMGVYGTLPLIVCWCAQNLGGHHRKSVGTAWQISFGNIGGIIATYSFLSKDAPKYVPGYSICIAFVFVSIASCTLYEWGCWNQNKQRERMRTDRNKSEKQKMELGDQNVEYRYML